MPTKKPYIEIDVEDMNRSIVENFMQWGIMSRSKKATLQIVETYLGQRKVNIQHEDDGGRG